MTKGWYFYKWAERVEIFPTTRTFWKYALSKNDSHITAFGRLFLRFIWCEYKPITNVVVFYQFENNSLNAKENSVIYQCIPGIIPNFLYWRFYNDKPQTSINS